MDNPALIDGPAEKLPAPFLGECFVLRRDEIEMHVSGFCCGAKTTYKAKGVLYLSDVRFVFVADKVK